MTEVRKPPACHYDRQLGERVTREHRDDCPDPIGHAGCVPCTAPHCLVCGREHLDNAHPHTCPKCQGIVDDDLAEIQAAYTALHVEAREAGRDGRLVAAAPIPGGTAAVLVGPAVRLDKFSTYHGFRKDHRLHDPMPPLAVLAQWEDIYRTWLDQRPKIEATPDREVGWRELVAGPRRASIAGAISYLRTELPYIANHLSADAPDFVEFTRQIRRLRSDCERALHDEQEPERGVECFECGDRLVRRFRVAKRCRHSTKPRRQLVAWMHDRAEILDQIRRRREKARAWLTTIESYPELGPPYPSEVEAATTPPTVDESRAAAAPPASLIAAARMPCRRCAKSQGGIDNPDPGRSWECPGCRREYTPGEYANAVRRDLVDHGAEGDGWTHVTMAADAASTLVGMQVPANTVRRWMDRGKVMSLCLWHHEVEGRGQVPAAETVTDWQAMLASYAGRVVGRPWGQRLVYWPDVADQAVEAVDRARVAAEERRRRAAQLEALGKAIAKGEDPDEAGARLGIHPARVEVMVAELERASAEDGKVSA